MKTPLRRALVLSLLSMCLLPRVAEGRMLPPDGGQQLVVTLTDGSTERFPLAAHPCMTIAGGRLVVAAEGSEASFALADVQRYTFAPAGASGIGAIAAGAPQAVMSGQTLAVEGLQEGQEVTVRNAAGATVAAARADSRGTVTIALQHQPAGVYLITHGRHTTKIVKP